MMQVTDFSIVIPTRNRFKLLSRAISSAIHAGLDENHITVVDDHSDDRTADQTLDQFPNVNVVRLAQQSGPCVARNRGMERITTKYVILMDDDDTLNQDALQTVIGSLSLLDNQSGFPVFQFAQHNASLDSDFFIATLGDYARGALSGDFAPVVQVDVFRHLQLAYPESIVGGENRLWFQVAKTTGIPTWNKAIVTVTSDATSRLCSCESQMRKPTEYAVSAEAVLQNFGSDLQLISPRYYQRKRIGAAVYRLLAGERVPALRHAKVLYLEGARLQSIGVVACAAVPVCLFRTIFRNWRRVSMA